MKSYLFTTETDRGGVMLCDIDDFDTAVEYLCERFDGVVKVESGDEFWQLPVAGTVEGEVSSQPEQQPDPQPAIESDLFG